MISKTSCIHCVLMVSKVSHIHPVFIVSKISCIYPVLIPTINKVIQLRSPVEIKNHTRMKKLIYLEANIAQCRLRKVRHLVGFLMWTFQWCEIGSFLMHLWSFPAYLVLRSQKKMRIYEISWSVMSQLLTQLFSETHPLNCCCFYGAVFFWSNIGISLAERPKAYRSGTVNSNTVNSKFHLIRSYCKYLATILSFHV